MLIVVRHGRTALNEDGTERMRGWSPVPLTPEGEQDAVRVGQQLQRWPDPIHRVVTSDLPRAQQTAATIGQAVRQAPTVEPGLRDWNIGILVGQPVHEMLPVVHELLDHPDSAPPHGEPYAAFAARVMPTLDRLVRAPGTTVAVTHNRVLTLASAMAQQKPALLKEKGPVEPGGFLVIGPDWKIQHIAKGDGQEG